MNVLATNGRRSFAQGGPCSVILGLLDVKYLSSIEEGGAPLMNSLQNAWVVERRRDARSTCWLPFVALRLSVMLLDGRLMGVQWPLECMLLLSCLGIETVFLPSGQLTKAEQVLNQER